MNAKIAKRILNVLYLAEADRTGHGDGGQEPVRPTELETLFDEMNRLDLLGDPGEDEIRFYRGQEA
jgi:hypothetical protein